MCVFSPSRFRFLAPKVESFGAITGGMNDLLPLDIWQNIFSRLHADLVLDSKLVYMLI